MPAPGTPPALPGSPSPTAAPEGLRIIHLIEQLTAGGGAEGQLALLASGLQRRGVPTEIWCYKKLPPGHGLPLGDHVPIRNLGSGRLWRPRLIRALERELRDRSRQILHTWMTSANFYGRMARLLIPGLKLVSSERTSSKGRWLCLSDRLLAPASDLILANSSTVSRYLAERAGVPTEQIRIIPNGLDMGRFHHLPAPAEARAALGLPSDALVVGTIGRFIPDKRHEWILEAVAGTGQMPRNIHVLMGGWGEREQALRQRARSLGLEDRTRFPGLVGDVRPLLRAMDLFLLPSRREGMPNVVLEALACGVPVVATEVGGMQEVLGEAAAAGLACGRVVPVEDQEGFARAVSVYLADPALRQTHGARGRAWAERAFSHERMVDRHLAVYRSLLAGR